MSNNCLPIVLVFRTVLVLTFIFLANMYSPIDKELMHLKKIWCAKGHLYFLLDWVSCSLDCPPENGHSKDGGTQKNFQASPYTKNDQYR